MGLSTKRRRKWLRWIVITLLICGAILLLRDIWIELFPNQRFEAAQSLWASKQIDSYRMVLNINEYHRVLGLFQVTVRDGKVIEVTNANPFDAPFEDFDNYNLDFYIEFMPEHLREYTVDNLFNIVKSQIQNMPTVNITRCQYTTLDFDPSLGYIRHFEATSYRPGWFCGSLHTTGVRFTITHFEILE